MTENKNVETILKNGDKALSGMPYLYRLMKSYLKRHLMNSQKS